MPHGCYRFFPLLFVILLAAPADATTRRVPSEYPTIQAGINAAATGDTVLVAPGTYAGFGNNDIEFEGKDIVLVSEAGPQATIIDASSAAPPMNDNLGFYLYEGETNAARIDGFTVRGARNWYNGRFGAGILCYNASPTIANCIISQNWAGQSDPYKQSGQFGCGVAGGILIESTLTPMTIINCMIVENGANCSGGAVYIRNAEVLFDGCTFFQNREVSVIVADGADVTFSGCTIAQTTTYEGWGNDLYVGPGGNVSLESTVVWGTCSQITVAAGGTLQVTCSVVDNSKVVGPGSIQYVGQNVFADPLFCSAVACGGPPFDDIGDYRVMSASPCLPENNPCGVLIGALGSCAATSVPTSPGFPDNSIWASPNPFSTSTSLSLGAALDRDATLHVFDVAGRRVREFRVTPGADRVFWDGADDNAQRVGAGTYLLRLEGAQRSAGRVTIVR